MFPTLGVVAATFCLVTVALPARLTAQPRPAKRPGGFVPGQQRPPEDPRQVARGKTLYGVHCTICHGVDLRGGDRGGPSLLRSQAALSDRNGELIIPIVQGSRQAAGMPAIAVSPADATALAAYVRSIMATIGKQGMPPSIGRKAPSVLTGDARAGQAYFAAKCASCHSPIGDLRGIAKRIPDPKLLQNRWVSGGGRGGTSAAVTVAVTPPSEDTVEGRLIRIDDFLVTVGLADGTTRTFRRDGDVPKVDVRDPLKTHRDLLAVYTDKDMHDVTAYLVTLK